METRPPVAVVCGDGGPETCAYWCPSYRGELVAIVTAQCAEVSLDHGSCQNGQPYEGARYKYRST